MRKEIFQSGKSCLGVLLQPLRLQTGYNRKMSGKRKPGKLYQSSLPGVEVAGFEVAGFETQPQSSRNALGAGAPLVSVDSFTILRLRRRPTGATVGSLTPGLLVPNSWTPFERPKMAGCMHKLPLTAVYCRIIPSADRRTCQCCNAPRCYHSIPGALPFGQSLGSLLDCMPIFSVKSPRDISCCA